MSATRERLDALLVQRRLAESREKAQRLIRAGVVRVDGQPQTKPGHVFPSDAALEVEPFEIRAACPCGFDGPLAHDDVVAQGIATCPACGSVITFPPTPELAVVELEVAAG